MSSDTQTVQLIHQTVREFLLDREKLAEPYDLDELHGDQEIAMTCFSYIQLAFSADILQLEAKIESAQSERLIEYLSQRILLEYCLTHFVAHLEQSRALGPSISEELKTFIEALDSKPKSYASLLLSRWIASQWVEISGLQNVGRMASMETDIEDCLQSVLVSAAGLGKDEVVKIILLLGADVNARNKDNVYPLENAIRARKISTVILLLEKGAKTDAQGEHYFHALQVASQNSDREIIRLLLAYGADINAPGGPYGTSLEAGSLRGAVNVTKLLLSHGASSYAQGWTYENALLAAVS